MKQKTRGTVTLVCGIVCIVFSIIALVLRFALGEDLMGSKSILICLAWIALGIYFCYLGRKMKKENGSQSEEQSHLKTIIGTRVKYDRKNERRNKARRNENGLTPKQQELQDLKTKILELKEQGLNNTQIAKQLNVDKHRIYDAIHNKKLFYPPNYKYNYAVKKEYIL